MPSAIFLLLAAWFLLTGMRCENKEAEQFRMEAKSARARAERAESDNRQLRQEARQRENQHRQKLATEGVRRSWSDSYAIAAAGAFAATLWIILHLWSRRRTMRRFSKLLEGE